MNRLLKAAAALLACAIIAPVLAVYLAARVVCGKLKAFQLASHTVALIPGVLGVYCRRCFYCLIFPRFGVDVEIGFGTIFSHPTAALGNRVYIGAFCVIGEVAIDDDTLVASGVSIANGGQQHGIDRLDIPIREQPGTWQRVHIGADCWLGERSVVLADVCDHAVVAAGAVVTSPVPAYNIAAGVPARVIGDRRKGQIEWA